MHVLKRSISRSCAANATMTSAAAATAALRFSLPAWRHLPSHYQVSGRLEQFGDRAVSPVALALVVRPVTDCGHFEFGQLRLQRFDARFDVATSPATASSPSDDRAGVGGCAISERSTVTNV